MRSAAKAGRNPVRGDSVALEEERLSGIEAVEDYPSFHERHRIFPALFEDREHKRILDVAAGAGCSADRIQRNYPAEVLCNDASPTAIRILQNMGLNTVSFDLDDANSPFPLEDGSFDAVVALATIEHMINVDHFVREIHRVLADNGYFYVSAPNYNGINYVVPLLLKGKGLHDPLSPVRTSRYEFYAHVRYFTYRTLLEYVSSFGFVPEAVYLAVPQDSTRYRVLQERSKAKALAYRLSMKTFYTVCSPRWAPEPVLCLRKGTADGGVAKPRKVVL
jgi:2-polyprenyl-3-methyl-5-hydroxy-6-metoxy-1,4-benzoquinol methylase